MKHARKLRHGDKQRSMMGELTEWQQKIKHWEHSRDEQVRALSALSPGNAARHVIATSSIAAAIWHPELRR